MVLNNRFPSGILISSLLILVTVLSLSCNRTSPVKQTSDTHHPGGELIIFHAGSLAVPLKEISRQFEEANPDVRVLLESAGSVDCARKITELHKPCDLMASSDYKVIEQFLIPGYTGWYIPFASNSMVIAYTDNSAQADEIDTSNWFRILPDPRVRYARSDPGSDPCGYRTLMTLQLAEKHYATQGLVKKMEDKDLRYIRPKEVDLLALLEVGEVDYIFIYRSVAIQHGLKYLELPEEVDLSDPAFSDIYKEARVIIPGLEAGRETTLYGEPMVYAVTMLDNAPNHAAALAFLQFMLSKDKGMKVMEQMGQKSVMPSKDPYYTSVPDELKKYILK